MRSSRNAARRRRIAPALIGAVLAGSQAVPAVGESAGSPRRGEGAAVAGATVRPYGDGNYLAYAGRMQARLDARWDERRGRYRAGSGGTETMLNANLLLSHAVAAQAGDDGRARDDRRARLIARWLVEGSVWVERAPRGAGSHAHAPGWLAAPGAPKMHLVIDAEVVDGLVHAYRARHALALPERTIALIRDRIHRLARGPYWRWPAIRLNQINWYALVYAADATVTGDGAVLARGLHNQLRRFLANVRPRAGAAGNLGPGLRFHYLPHRPVSHRMNLDSAEYANIVLSFTRFHAQARAAGMPALRGARLALMRAWVRRALAGYWTHAGYMNWDTGFGFKRWHQAKKLGLTQHALIGIATASELQPAPRYGAWAKHLLDRSLAFYERQALRSNGIAPGVLFGVNEVPQSAGSARLGAARVQANAARALAAGLGRLSSSRPPALYAYDPDTGRLAITTPAYSTTFLAVNGGAVPYGGIEPARLLDGEGEVAAGIGGRPPASFGLVVRGRDGRRLLATQEGRSAVRPGVAPLRLTSAPSGVGATAATHSRRAFSGPFGRLRVVGSLRRAGIVAVARHSLSADAIETRWSLRRDQRSPVSVEALFPSWGRRATVTAVREDGTRVAVGRRRIPLAGVVRLVVSSQRSRYSVIPLSRPSGATLRLLAVAPQASAPTPGPTLAISLAHDSSAHRLAFAARVLPGR